MVQKAFLESRGASSTPHGTMFEGLLVVRSIGIGGRPLKTGEVKEGFMEEGN